MTRCAFLFAFSDDINIFQSLSAIENPKLRAIFLMLRSTLRDEDIPKRTTLRICVEEAFYEYLEALEKDLKVRIFMIKIYLL